jgi:HEAT repeat protein
MGVRAKEAIPALQTAIRDEDSKVSDCAAYALARIGTPAVPALIEALGYKEPQARGSAACRLGWLRVYFGKSAVPPTVAPALIKSLKDEAACVRLEAIEALTRLEDKRAIAPLLEVARHDRDIGNRTQATLALGAFRAAAEPVIPDLVHILKEDLDPEPASLGLRLAADALRRLGSDADLGEERRIERGIAAEVQRRTAALSLACIGESAAPALVDVIRDGKNSLDARVEAASALGRMAVEAGPEAARAGLPALVELLKSPESRLRSEAVHALRRFGKVANAAVPGKGN